MRNIALLIALTSTVCLASADTLKASVTSMNKKVNAAFQKRGNLLFEHFLRFVKRGRTVRLDSQIERSNCARNESSFARRFTRQFRARDVDLRQFIFQTVCLQTMPRREYS